MRITMFTDRLAPRWSDRVRHWLRPGWARALLVRRSAAVALVVAAAVFTVADHRAERGQSAILAAHDLLPGQVLTGDDLVARRVTSTDLPGGSLRRIAEGVGHTVTSTVRAGEIVTDARLLTARLPTTLRGDHQARLVPVRLADPAVADLLREGDVVDVLDDTGDVLARDAVVALAATRRTSGLTGNSAGVRPILVAMRGSDAQAVAAAGLNNSLTVVLH